MKANTKNDVIGFISLLPPLSGYPPKLRASARCVRGYRTNADSVPRPAVGGGGRPISSAAKVGSRSSLPSLSEPRTEGFIQETHASDWFLAQAHFVRWRTENCVVKREDEIFSAGRRGSHGTWSSADAPEGIESGVGTVPIPLRTRNVALANKCLRLLPDTIRSLLPTKSNGDQMHTILPSNDLAGEIAKYKLTHVDREASILEASKLMRKSGATELLVTSVTNGVFLAIGIVTANDIVTRVIAAELDPAVLTAGDITWSGALAPSFSHQ
jgi:hypothetical protein